MTCIVAKDAQTTYVFGRLSDFTGHPRFGDMVYVSLGPVWQNEDLPPLPPSLQILRLYKTRVKFLCGLPDTVREVYARTNKLIAIFGLSGCRDLEYLDVRDNDIRVLHGKSLPDGLRTLDASYNKLISVTGRLPAGLVHLDLSYNFLRATPELPEGCSLVSSHMFDERYVKNRASAGTSVAVPKPRAIYDNNQNVHASSVQTSVSSSVEKLMRVVEDWELPDDHAEEVLGMWGCSLTRWLPWRRTPPVREWCRDTTVHSQHGITFDHLLRMVWAIVCGHEHEKALKAVLREELEASRGYCFTGRFTRVINVLTGFVDGVGVGISEAEQMQSRIAAAVRAGGDDVRAKVEGILDEFKVFGQSRAAWLDALPS